MVKSVGNKQIIAAKRVTKIAGFFRKMGKSIKLSVVN